MNQIRIYIYIALSQLLINCKSRFHKVINTSTHKFKKNENAQINSEFKIYKFIIISNYK